MLNCGQFAVIQRLEVEEWPLLFPEDDSLTGVIAGGRSSTVKSELEPLPRWLSKNMLVSLMSICIGYKKPIQLSRIIQDEIG